MRAAYTYLFACLLLPLLVVAQVRSLMGPVLRAPRSNTALSPHSSPQAGHRLRAEEARLQLAQLRLLRAVHRPTGHKLLPPVTVPRHPSSCPHHFPLESPSVPTVFSLHSPLPPSSQAPSSPLALPRTAPPGLRPPQRRRHLPFPQPLRLRTFLPAETFLVVHLAQERQQQAAFSGLTTVTSRRLWL